MIRKTIDEIRTKIIEAINTKIPELDLTEGTPERDLFVEAAISGKLLELWNNVIYAAKLHAPMVYYEDITQEDIENYVSNFNVIPEGATQSSGEVTFYTYNEPTSDIIISEGTRVGTVDSPPIEFYVDGDYSIPEEIKSSYYNTVDARWEITCTVVSVESGPEYRAGSSAIKVLLDSIPGIDGCINDNVVGGGLPAEDTIVTLRKVIDKFQGRGLASTIGIKELVNTYADAVNIVGANDPQMLRDQGIGGAIDIYIIGEDLTTAIDSVTMTSTGLQGLNEVSYTSTGYIFNLQPVHTIQAFSIDGATVPVDYYALEKDTGVLKKSTKAYDKLILTSSGIVTMGPFSPGNEITITYNYNGLLHDITDDLNSTTNHYQNRDYLLREMNAVTIDVYAKIKEVDGQDFNSIVDTAELNVDIFISAIQNSGSLELADVIGEIKNTTGVDNIDLTTVSISNIDGGTQTAQGDVFFDKNEYPVTGTITLERWES